MELQMQLDSKKINDFLLSSGLEIQFQVNADCSHITSARSGGRCNALIEAPDEKVLSGIIKYLHENNAPFYIIGDGTNLLFNDGYIDMYLIKLTGDFKKMRYAGNGLISAGAGCSLAKLVIFSAKYSLDLSFLAGIPGTTGGAVAGNAGSANEGICNFIRELNYLAFSGNAIESRKAPLNKTDYGYRFCKIKDMAAINSVLIAPEKAERDEIFSRIRQRIKNKKKSQPLGWPSSGCFFKNPSGTDKSAGEMIDVCGLKGFIFGGAQISQKHANFIVNSGSASARDFFVLSHIAAMAVKDKYNIELENEVRLVGF